MKGKCETLMESALHTKQSIKFIQDLHGTLNVLSPHVIKKSVVTNLKAKLLIQHHVSDHVSMHHLTCNVRNLREATMVTLSRMTQ